MLTFDEHTRPSRPFDPKAQQNLITDITQVNEGAEPDINYSTCETTKGHMTFKFIAYYLTKFALQGMTNNPCFFFPTLRPIH